MNLVMKLVVFIVLALLTLPPTATAVCGLTVCATASVWQDNTSDGSYTYSGEGSGSWPSVFSGTVTFSMDLTAEGAAYCTGNGGCTTDTLTTLPQPIMRCVSGKATATAGVETVGDVATAGNCADSLGSAADDAVETAEWILDQVPPIALSSGPNLHLLP